MELLIDTIRSLSHRRGADARLALLIVLGALKTLMPDDERAELALGLPMELNVLLSGEATPEDSDALEELGLVDAHTLEVVCRVLSAGATPSVRAMLHGYVLPQLREQRLGGRSTTQSVGADAFGPVTVRAAAHLRANAA